MQQISGKDKVNIGHDTMFDFTKTILSITIFHNFSIYHKKERQ